MPSPRRSPENARAEVVDYLQIALNVARAAVHWTDITESLWLQVESGSARGALVFAESRRVAALCGAVALAEVPAEAQAAHDGLTSALLGRQAWAAAEAAVLRASLEMASEEIESQRAATVMPLERALGYLNELAAEYQLDDIVVGDHMRAVENEQGRVAIEVPPGWLVGRADAQTVLIAPLELQSPGISGVGPSRESYGTALRVRRLRNPAGRTLTDVVEAIGPLLDGFGEKIARLDARVDGYPAVGWLLEDAATGWDTHFAVVLARDYTFTLELGCPRPLRLECSSVADDLLGRITLQP